MSISVPKFISTAWASIGQRFDIPKDADPSTGKAGYSQGFGPVNLTPVEAGGIPPWGQDMNGVLFDLSSAIRYAQSGAAFPYDSSFATAISGYPQGAIVSDSSSTSILWINNVNNNTQSPSSSNGWTQLLLTSGPSEIARGMPMVATQSEVMSGTDDSKSVSPKKLRAGFSMNLGFNGYISFPTWLGGLIIQWGASLITSNLTSIRITFPTAFPTSFLSASLLSTSTASNPVSCWRIAHSNGNMDYAVSAGSGGGNSLLWIAIGY